MKVRMCRECDRPLQPQRVPVLEGTAEGWRVELRDYPVLACPMGHERREAYADFNVAWWEHLYDRLGMDPRRRGLINRRYECRSCGEELREPRVDSAEVEVRAHPEHVFRLHFTGELVRCRCGSITIIHSDMFSEAVIDAMRRHGLRH